jgi:type II secretory pathway pseudopilin PulG
VIAVISILAAMVFPITGAVNRAKIRTRARAELAKMQLAIEAYKTKLGYYPPSDPTRPALNPLFYELMGTRATNNNSLYVTLDGNASIPANVMLPIFGTNISGFLNCTRGGPGDEAQLAKKFLPDLKQGQFLTVTNSGVAVFILGASVDGPLVYQTLAGKINPWQYNSAAPVHNPNSYDLWIDVYVGKTTNRICNWTSEPLIVGSPY